MENYIAIATRPSRSSSPIAGVALASLAWPACHGPDQQATCEDWSSTWAGE